MSRLLRDTYGKYSLRTMAVKEVPTLGWTRGSLRAKIALVTDQHRQEIAARIREAMAHEGLTNSSLARRADLSEKTVSRLINAKMDPRYDTLERVAKALGVTERELRGVPSAPLGLQDASGGGTDAAAEILERLDRIESLVKRLTNGLLADAVGDAVEEALDPTARTTARPDRAPRQRQRRAG